MITWLLVGLALGFVLEAGGLGDPRKLTGIFHLKDWTVPQVMGTSIVVAMAGGLVLALAGFDTAAFFTPPTRPLGQAIGGFLFGAGFYLGGYCPGTSVVALGAGRLDALPFMGGMVGAYYAWDAVRPHVKGLVEKAPAAKDTLPEVLGLSPHLVAAILVAGGGAVLALLLRRRARVA